MRPGTNSVSRSKGIDRRAKNGRLRIPLWFLTRVAAGDFRPIAALLIAVAVPLLAEAQTFTVRREWPATPQDGSQPLVWLNVIDAAHTVPGGRGNYPPCASPACDIDAFRVLLQFWRANAGLQTRWR